MTEPPRIETDRLILRGRTVEDFAAYREIWANPETTRFIGGASFSTEDSWMRFSRAAGQWRLCGYGLWAVEERSSGKFIGEVGAADFKRIISPPLEGMPECAWSLDPAVHGRGYASEALAAALGWLDATSIAERFCCIVDPANRPSIRVAERAGFRLVGKADYKGAELNLYHRPRVVMAT